MRWMILIGLAGLLAAGVVLSGDAHCQACPPNACTFDSECGWCSCLRSGPKGYCVMSGGLE